MTMDPKGHQIVHVRGDSDTDLEDLFRAVMNPTGIGKEPLLQHPVPLRQRKLPASFFKEPDKPANSPSGSHSRESSTDSTNPGGPFGGQTLGVPVHPRAHSSPASLQQMQAASQQQTVIPQHTRHTSYDVTTLEDLPLPPGWEVARTPSGQRYFLNHVDQTTTWSDPRKSLTHTQLAQLQQARLLLQQQQQQQQQQQPQQPDLGPLPATWEQSSTPEGMRSPAGQSGTQLNRNQQLQQALQQQQQLAQQQGPLSRQQHPQKERLQQLQLEREKLRRRQLEIQQQIRKEIVGEDGQPISNTNQQSQDREMTSVSTTGVDPFLSGGTYHSRDESGDSGLGMSSNYSLPRTPDDMLSNVDEMDTSDGERKPDMNAANTIQTPMNDYLETMQGTNVDLGSLDTGDDDGEDLVPSLQEALSTDILNDVEAVLSPHKIENFLTWL